jgi:hypothetical protein
MVLKDHAFLAMLSKDEAFYGDVYPQPLIYGRPNGRSSTFTNAKANKTNSKLRKFNLERFADYALASIPNEVIEASENDKGAFVSALKVEVDGAILSAKESAAKDCYGTGTGSLGVIAATTVIGTPVMVLADAFDALYFEEGMTLQVSATNGGGAVRAGTLTVASVDRDGGTVTMTGNLTAGVAAIAVGDFVFQDGDYDLKMPGLSAWLPDTAPTLGDNFFGVDRSVDPERLAGLRFDGSSFSIEEALIKGASRLHARGANPDCVFVHYDDYSDLEVSLGAKVQYCFPQAAGRADISFKGIQLNTPKGRPLAVIPDTYARKGRGFMIQKSTWKLRSLKKMVRILDLDGNKFLRDSDADSVEIRVGGYKVLGCSAPGWNANIKLG